MDHGALTDNNGRKADFRNVILVMTTNAGASAVSRNSVGFKQQDNSTDDTEAIQKLFTPEFRNRIDATIRFNPLSREVLAMVVDKELLQVERQLEDKDVSLEVDQSARDWLAEHGYDPQMGARPLARLIQNEVKRGLADELLFGKLAKGGTVLLSADNDKLKFSIKAKKSKDLVAV
jgi:ATP-dependent Clp protease ATP-binding subunit ClpA